ncbi:MAG: YeeE/YedE family protein [Candidatus Eiseniibacteriota bacterium]
MTTLANTLRPAARQPFATIQAPAVAAAALALSGGALALYYGVDLRRASLLLIGGGLGVALYHAAFGFTGGWRAFVADRRGAGLRGQMLLFALATLIMLPILAGGSLFGRPLASAVAPVGLSVLVGAFLFGLGMQLGGGCGSGTLFTVGGGNTRMIVTLLFFVAGSVVGTAHLPWWLNQPTFSEISLADTLGLMPALVLQLALYGVIAWLTVVAERRRHGTVHSLFQRGPATGPRWLNGPWPLAAGAVALALLGTLALAVAGHMWSITFAFGLWGAKALAALGVNVASWEFWTWPFPAKALAGSVFEDTTSVMDFGIILGALLAAGLAGRFAPGFRIPLRSLLGGALGGLLMGYGARLAFGCNIGALLSGLASGSVHAWLWFAAAFVGTILGVRLRPLFGLAVERTRALTG